MLYDCLEYIIHHGIIANFLTGIKSENFHAGQTINVIFLILKEKRTGLFLLRHKSFDRIGKELPS